MKSFITKLSLVTFTIALIGWLVFSLFLSEFYLPIFPWLLIFFYALTLAAHAYQINLAKKDMGKFTRSTMLITFFRLIIYSVVAIIYIAVDKENAVPFVIGLFFLYLVFTFIEVSEATRISHKSNK